MESQHDEIRAAALRSLRARTAALASQARDPEEKIEAGRRGQKGLLKRFLRQVDPDHLLPEDERIRRAEAARRAHMSSLAYRSAKARSQKGSE